jgi:hypothetical protein
MNEKKLLSLYTNGKKHFNLPDFESFKKDMQDEAKLSRFRESMLKHYDLPDLNTMKSDLGLSQVKKKDETIPSISKQEAEPSASDTVPTRRGDGRSAASGLLNQMASYSGVNQPKQKEEQPDSKYPGKSKYQNVVTPNVGEFSGYPNKENNVYKRDESGQWSMKKTVVKTKADPNRPEQFVDAVEETWEEVNHPERVQALDKFFVGTNVNDPEYKAEITEKYNQKKVLSKIKWEDFTEDETSVVKSLNSAINSVPEYSGLFEIEEIAPGSDAIRITNRKNGKTRDVNVGYSDMKSSKAVSDEIKGFIELSIQSMDHDSKVEEMNNIQAELGYAGMMNPSLQNIEKVKRYNELKEETEVLDADIRKYASGNDALEAAYYTNFANKNLKAEEENFRIQTKEKTQELVGQADWYKQALEAKQNGQISDEEWQSNWAPKIEETKASMENLKREIEADKMRVVSKTLDIEKSAAAHAIMREKEGSTISGVTKSALTGAGSVFQFMLGDYTIDEYGRDLSERFADQFTPQVVTKEYLTSEDRNAFQKVVFGLSESIGSAVTGAIITGGQGGSYAGTLAMYANSYTDLRTEMESPEFKDVPEYEKIMMATMYGATVGYLEKFGLTKAFSKTPVGKKAVSFIMRNAVKEIPKNASAEAIEIAIKNSTKAAIANRVIQVSGGTIMEGSTEVGQEAAGMLLKSAYNDSKGKELFQQTPKTWGEVGSRLWESFYLGALGGSMMNSMTQLGNIVSSGDITSDTFKSTDFNTMTAIVKDDNILSMYKKYLNAKIATGEITKQQAETALKGVDDFRTVVDKMPDEVFKNRNGVEAFTLIKERERLEKELEGKDKALSQPKMDRIKAINEQLTKLAQIDVDVDSEIVKDKGILSSSINVSDDRNRKGLVPINQLIDFIGEDRLGSAQMPTSRATIDKLKDDIKINGFKNPLIVVYDKFSNGGEASIIEGNHRIQAALELGLREVPVIFEKGTIRTNEQRMSEGMFPLNRKNVGEIDTRFGVDGTKLGLEVRQPNESDFITKRGKVEQEEIVIDKPTISTNSKVEVDKVVSAAPEAETGQTFNFDGTVYSDGGLVVPVISENLTQEELTPERIAEFTDKHKSKIGSKTVKVGIYKFPNSNQVSIDLSIVVPRNNRQVGLEFGRIAGQESLFDLDTFENVKTGADGKNPLTFTDDQFKEISKALEEGRVPSINTATQVEAKPSTVTTQNYQTVETAMEGKRTNASNQKVADVYEAVRTSLKASPNTKIVVHETRDEYLDAIANKTGMTRTQIEAEEAAGTTFGSYLTEDGEVHIDLTGADKQTVYHEVFHDLVKQIGLTSDAMIDMVKGLKEVVTNKSLIAKIDKFVESYEKGERSEEFLAEIVSDLASGIESLDTTKIQKLISLINKIASKLGLPQILSSKASRSEVVDFVNRMAKSLREGREIGELLDIESDVNQSVTPGSFMDAVVISRKKSISNSKIEDFDTTPTNDAEASGVKMIYPEKTTIESVLEMSGGAAVFINSDGTKVGRVTINGRELLLQGGIDYTFIEENVNDNIGFAASEDAKISSLKSIASQIQEERDSKFLEHRGKPVAIFVTAQNGETMLGEWYAGEYIVEGIDAAIQKKKYKGGLRQAKSDFQVAVSEVTTGKTKEGVADNKAKRKLLQMISDGEFDTQDGRLRIARLLSSKEFSFGFRVNLIKGMIASNEKSSNSGRHRNLKKSLANVGHTLVDFWDNFMDGRLLNSVKKEPLAANKGGAAANKTFSGFFYDPSESLEGQIEHAKLGIDHAQFNSSFKSKGNFLLDSAYDINKLFPNMGYPTQSGIDEYNSKNNTSFTKKSMSLIDKLSVTEWLLNNDMSNLVVNPYSSVSLSIYTGIVSDESYRSGRKKRMTEPVPGNKLFNQPLPEATEIAKAYMERTWMDYVQVEKISKLDESNSKRIANAYDQMKGDPTNPEVKEAYDAMINETIDQYEEIIQNGYVVEVNNQEPYSSSEEMINDLKDNKRMKIFSTESGFGDEAITDEQRESNPLLRDTKYKDVNGVPLLANDLFRFVHDFFGHAKMGNGFGPIGEENAWRIHSVMYSDLAVKAMTSETRGQNSWVNFSGVNKEAFKKRDKARELRQQGKVEEADALVGEVYEEMSFADQKVGILPEFAWKQGAPARKKRISSPDQKEAINKAQDEYNLSLKRGNSEPQAIDAAINDLKKNEWYKNASDIDRENAIRELRESLGLKKKSAPSVQKITGKPKDKLVTVNERIALRNQIMLEVRAAREGAKSEKDIRKEIADNIKSLLGKIKGKIPGQKITTIINKALKLNLSNPEMADRLADYALKLARDSEYDNKLSQANKLLTQLKRAMKSGDIQKNNVAMANAFKKIKPSFVDDIDLYIEKAQSVLESLKKSGLKADQVIYKTQTEVGDVMEYVQEQMKAQEAFQMEMLKMKFPELFESGYISESDSLSEVLTKIDMLEAVSDTKLTDEQKDKIRSSVVANADYLGSVLSEMISTGIDPITGEAVDIDQDAKALFVSLLKADKSKMDISELLRMVDVLQNAIINSETGGVAAFVAKINGRTRAAAFLKSNGATNKRIPVQKLIGSVTTMVATVLDGVSRGSKFMVESSINKIRSQKTKAILQANEVVEAYTKKFEAYRPNRKKFSDPVNVVERGMYAFLTRNVVGDATEMSKEFHRRVDLVKESLAILESDIADERMSFRAKHVRAVAEKLGIMKMGVSIDDIVARVDSVNVEAVNYWVDVWAKNYEDLSRVSSTIYNKELGSDMNYNPDVFKRIMNVHSDAITDRLKEFSRKGSFGVYDVESGSLKTATRPKKLPFDPDTKQTFMYVDFDFDSNVSDAFSSALIDIKTAEAIREWEGFSTSESMRELVPNQKTRTELINKINEFIMRTRGVDNASVDMKDAERFLLKVTNAAAKIGTSLMLGGMDQVLKQSISMMANTAVNSLYISRSGVNVAGNIFYRDEKTGEKKFVNTMSLTDAFSKKYTEWLERGGVDVSLRGIESAGVISKSKDIGLNEDKLSWLLDNLGAVSEKYVETFLVSTDKFVARAAFKTYYMKYLLENGKDLKVDLDGDMDEQAKAYAMTMVSKQQGESDADMQSRLYTNNNAYFKSLIRLLMPLSSFVMNKKASMASDISILRSKTATAEDKAISTKSLLSSIIETATYTATSVAIRALAYDVAARAITGYDPEDDDPRVNDMVRNENRRRKSLGLLPMSDSEDRAFRRSTWESIYYKSMAGEALTNSVRDLFSVAPVFDYYTLSLSDDLIKDYIQQPLMKSEIEKAIKEENRLRAINREGKMDEVEREEFIQKYLEEKAMRLSVFDDKGYGAYDFTNDKVKLLFDIQVTERNGTVKSESFKGTSEQYLLPSDKKVANNLAAYSSLAIFLPSDGFKILDKSYRQVKKRAVTYNRYKLYKDIKSKYGSEPEGLEDMIRKGLTEKQIYTEVYKRTSRLPNN